MSKIIDIIFIQGNEKFQITGKELSNENNIIKIEPMTVVLEDIAGAVSDVEIDDRTTPDPSLLPEVPMLDDLSHIEMELWKSVYVSAFNSAQNFILEHPSIELSQEDVAGRSQVSADQAISVFRQSFGILMEKVETPE